MITQSRVDRTYQMLLFVQTSFVIWRMTTCAASSSAQFRTVPGQELRAERDTCQERQRTVRRRRGPPPALLPIEEEGPLNGPYIRENFML